MSNLYLSTYLDQGFEDGFVAVPDATLLKFLSRVLGRILQLISGGEYPDHRELEDTHPCRPNRGQDAQLCRAKF